MQPPRASASSPLPQPYYMKAPTPQRWPIAQRRGYHIKGVTSRMMLKSRCQWCVHCQCGTLMNIADVQTSHYQERFIHVVVSNKWVLRGTMKANIIIKIASGLLPIPTYFFACHFTDDQKANRLSKDRRFSTITKPPDNLHDASWTKQRHWADLSLSQERIRIHVVQTNGYNEDNQVPANIGIVSRVNGDRAYIFVAIFPNPFLIIKTNLDSQLEPIYAVQYFSFHK